MPLPPPLDRDPLAVLAVSTAPIVLEGRYRLLVGALVRLRRSRRGRWAVVGGYGTVAIGLALLAALGRRAERARGGRTAPPRSAGTQSIRLGSAVQPGRATHAARARGRQW